MRRTSKWEALYILHMAKFNVACSKLHESMTLLYADQTSLTMHFRFNGARLKSAQLAWDAMQNHLEIGVKRKFLVGLEVARQSQSLASEAIRIGVYSPDDGSQTVTLTGLNSFH